MNKTTRSLHTKVDTQLAYPAVTPLYQNSAFESQSEFFYSRKNTESQARQVCRPSIFPFLY